MPADAVMLSSIAAGTERREYHPLDEAALRAPAGGDGVVNVTDLLALLGACGPCP